MGIGGTAPPFLTSALDGGEWSDLLSDCFTASERVPPIGWAPEPAWTLWNRKKSLLGIEPRPSST
jgi:hypothetical protein